MDLRQLADMASFGSLFRKASSLLGMGGDSLKPPPLDGEIIYCKNNVCVHPPAPLALEVDHHPGYLTIRAHQAQGTTPTLILTWIPNSSLKKNPRSIENSPNKSHNGSPRASPRRPKQEFAKSDGGTSPSISPGDSSTMGMSDIMERGADFPDQQLEERPVPRPRKKHSTDNTSISSELSLGSRDECHSLDSWNTNEDGSKDIPRLSSSNKSQTDSGLGSDEMMAAGHSYVQNNEKSLPSAHAKPSKVGVNVNDLHHEKQSKSNMEPKNLMATAVEEESSSAESDGLTPEEQLAAMLNRNKLHAKARDRTDSNRSVSIEMEGDKLVVVTEEQEKYLAKDEDISEKNINTNDSKFDTSSSTDIETGSLSSDSPHPSPSGTTYEAMLGELQAGFMTSNGQSLGAGAQGGPSTEGAPGSQRVKEPGMQDIEDVSPLAYRQPLEGGLGAELRLPGHLSLHGPNHPPPNTPVLTPDISVTRCLASSSSSSSSTTTSGPDSRPPSPFDWDAESGPSSPTHESSTVMGSPCGGSQCSLSASHNMTFPENSVNYSTAGREQRSPREMVCGVFSVDLGQMRSLRLFYSDPGCTQGQVVIASRESQYKILHFHRGGLDKLAEIFEEWSLFAKSNRKVREGDAPYRQFLVVKPNITDDQCHPEEGLFSIVTEDIWRQQMSDDGAIEDDFFLRKAIFFGGLDPSLRPMAWPYLLHYYPWSATIEECEQIRNDKYIEYQDIRKKREALTPEERESFWRTIQYTVEKDVVRTDRSHPYFAGEDNPNIEVLKNILLNYAVANPGMGYTQGMSDLLAPVLAEVQHEADAFWCFTGLMQRTIFVSSPTDSDMDRQLGFLRELMRLMLPKFYTHLRSLSDDAMELLFCHRWILLCFKREFPEEAALQVWEACWTHYQTDYFHLFICLAIVAIYGDDVIDQRLPADEILLHFSSLAMHMNGELVLRKARGLLYQYRQLERIPCTLHGLCALCGAGMWDSGHVPTVECVGHPPEQPCPYSSQPGSPA